MGLSREEIEQVALETADQVIAKLHRNTVAYHSPATIPEGLKNSMGEELNAAFWYRERAADAASKGDRVTAELYAEIAGEEDQHYREFNQRLISVARGANG